jgi:hypothetical protein
MIGSAEAASAITYLDDRIVWSWSTVFACLVGWSVHWLSLYNKAFHASKKIGTPPPGPWTYWTGDWPSTLKAFLIVSVGYFMLPEMGHVWPTFGRAIGVVAEDGTLLGLNMLSSFLWGVFGALFGDLAGKRLAKLME